MKPTNYYLRLALLAVGIAGMCWVTPVRADDQSTAAWQRGAIEGAFMFSPYLKASRVKVSIDANRAILEGQVESETGRALAEQLALSVKGIEQVVNKLVVSKLTEPPKQLNTLGLENLNAGVMDNRLSNVTITNKVKSQLLANRNTSGINIDIETSNRVVTITGLVGSDEERALAYWLVKNTRGVKTVIDKMDVESSVNRQAAIQLAE